MLLLLLITHVRRNDQEQLIYMFLLLMELHVHFANSYWLNYSLLIWITLLLVISHETVVYCWLKFILLLRMELHFAITDGTTVCYYVDRLK